MNPDWQEFLTRHGATIETNITKNFGDIAAELHATEQTTVLCDLSQFGTLRISGEDAQSFLQNLLSNDIREVSHAHAQFSSLNTAKGRMLATMLIWGDGKDYLLQLPHVLREPILKKLSMYVLRSKVKVTDASNEIVSLGLSGSNAQTLLQAQFGKVPQGLLDLSSNPDCSLIRIGDSKFQINSSAKQAAALWDLICKNASPVGSYCWDWLNIRSGIPVILPQTQEQFVAQMVNFDLIGGVNFKKGCYPGQEIVARTQYLGKLKRRMYLAHLECSNIPQAGDELFSEDMEGQASGMVVNTALSPTGGYDLLASLQISSRETQAVHWKSLQGEILHFFPMPYQLPGS